MTLVKSHMRSGKMVKSYSRSGGSGNRPKGGSFTREQLKKKFGAQTKHSTSTGKKGYTTMHGKINDKNDWAVANNIKHAGKGFRKLDARSQFGTGYFSSGHGYGGTIRGGKNNKRMRKHLKSK